MKISGFTIVKDLVTMDYPVVEAIKSILPIVDEMIVLIGDCNDDSESVIRSISSDKVKIHHSVWNPNLRKGGSVLAEETNKAFHLIDPTADWAFYIQGDEVVHEKYLPAIKEGCEKYIDDKRVFGLLFKYLHFYGTYDFVGDSRRWYNREIRIIRNDKTISSYRDAQGFRQGKKKLQVKEIEAYMYHYGWVKSPKKMQEKLTKTARYWNTDEELKPFPENSEIFNLNEFDSLQKFMGTHPAIMEKKIAEMNSPVKISPCKKLFIKDRILHFIEKQAGYRLFDYKNYRKI